MIYNVLFFSVLRLFPQHQYSFPLEKIVQDFEVLRIYETQEKDTLIIKNDSLHIICSKLKPSDVLEIRLKLKVHYDYEWVMLYQNQKKGITNNYVNYKISTFYKGKKQGVEIHQSGYYRIYSNFNNDKKNSSEYTYLTFNNDTIISKISNYKHGKLNGRSYYFDKGLLLGTIDFSNDLPNGEQILYHSNGWIKEKGRIKGYYSFIRKGTDDDFNWHINSNKKTNFNTRDMQTLCFTDTNFPDYLPKCEFETISGQNYPKRVGTWYVFDNKGVLLSKKNY